MFVYETTKDGIVYETTKGIAVAQEPLLPDRHPISDFFVCDIMDAAPKDDMASMEHPIFSLSTKPDTRIREYQHNGNSVKISPSMDGLATIHDKDILIFCISQLIAKMNRGEPLSRTVHLKAYDLLVTTNRRTDGDSYERLKLAFERLAGTRITTDIETKGERIIQGFGLIDSWKIIAKDKKNQRMASLSITLSEWMYNSVIGKEVLTLSRDYFRLRKPVERRVYEIARKHCGHRKQWEIGLSTLQKKCGSSAPLREFRRMIKNLVEHDHLPDYQVYFENDLVKFTSRKSLLQSKSCNTEFLMLKAETYEKARRVAPAYDVYYLEKEWQAFWVNTGKLKLQSPDAAFISFCKKRHVMQPIP